MSVSQKKFLVLTDEAIGPGHGTGAVLRKYFADHPKDSLLGLSVYPSPDADERWTARWLAPSGSWRDVARSIARLRFGAAIQKVAMLAAVRKERARVAAFRPDLIWVIVWGEAGFRMAEDTMKMFPDAPTYWTFWDFHEPEKFEQPQLRSRLKTVLHRAARVDAISSPLAAKISELADLPVEVENFFCSPLPAARIGGLLGSNDRLNPVVVGNIWRKEAFHAMVWLSAAARMFCPALGPVLWLSHPTSLSRLGLNVGCLPVGLVHGGYAPDPLAEALAGSSFCFVPVNGPRAGDIDYARYSLPSRISEVFAAGVPVVAIADKRTALAGYLERTGGGIAISPSDPARAIEELVEFLKADDERARMGAAARRYAEENFEPGPFRRKLFARLDAMAEGRSPVAA